MFLINYYRTVYPNPCRISLRSELISCIPGLQQLLASPVTNWLNCRLRK